MNWLVGFFQSIAQLIISVFNFIIDGIKAVITLIGVIPSYITFVFNLFLLLPGFIQVVFGLIFIILILWLVRSII